MRIRIVSEEADDFGTYAAGIQTERGWFVSKSPVMESVNRVLLDLRKSALRGDQSEAYVLIQGEAGTGKEFIAQMIHSGSRRARGPWVMFNCTSSELFETGFLGQDGTGLLDRAQDGTLFLDQVSELTSTHQAKLLEALKAYVNIRVIAATCHDLKEKVSQGKFLSDLYQLLAQVTIDLPSLKAHSEDILPIALQMAQKCFQSRGKKFSGFTSDAETALKSYSWPGNVRELMNVIERVALTWSSSGRLDARSLSLNPLASSNQNSSFNATNAPNLQLVSTPMDELGTEEMNYTDLKKKWSDSFEKQFLISILNKNSGNVSAAARDAKIDRSNFLRLLRRHGLKAVEYRKAAA